MDKVKTRKKTTKNQPHTKEQQPFAYHLVAIGFLLLPFSGFLQSLALGRISLLREKTLRGGIGSTIDSLKKSIGSISAT